MDHGARWDPGWHKSRTVRVIAPALTANASPGEALETLLSATVVTVADRPAVFGVTTRLWVDVPGDTLELTVAEADMLIAALRAFLPRLRAARTLLAEACANDQSADPAAVSVYMAALEQRVAARTVVSAR